MGGPLLAITSVGKVQFQEEKLHIEAQKKLYHVVLLVRKFILGRFSEKNAVYRLGKKPNFD